VAIKLLGHVFWSAATAIAADRRPGNDWVVELREPSRWSPSAVSDAATPRPNESSTAEPVWAETQPWWHD
jgi:hypothetical protein